LVNLLKKNVLFSLMNLNITFSVEIVEGKCGGKEYSVKERKSSTRTGGYVLVLDYLNAFVV